MCTYSLVVVHGLQTAVFACVSPILLYCLSMLCSMRI